MIFAFHGYPAMIHKLTYRRHNHDNIHVRGYREEGTTTTPFDMVVLNNLDRYQLALDAIRRIPRLSDQVETATARYWTTMERHKLYISEHGEDMPEVRELALGDVSTTAMSKLGPEAPAPVRLDQLKRDQDGRAGQEPTGRDRRHGAGRSGTDPWPAAR